MDVSSLPIVRIFTDDVMRLAHFIQRYPPALGGSEAYFARLSRFCADQGDQVTVFTTNAIALEAFWSPHGACVPAGIANEAGITVCRYPMWRMSGRRWLLKPLSLVPHRLWQCLTSPCNPISFAMWRDAGAKDEERRMKDVRNDASSFILRSSSLAFDAVHAAAYPYSFPIACARRLARTRDVPFFITPFLHLGDPADPNDPTRRGYTSPALAWLLKEADGVFVQTPSERAMAISLGVSPEKVILQGLGVEPSECTGGDRLAARERWGLPADAEVVGHLANLSWEKGTNDLLQAMEPLLHDRRPIYLLLAGPEMPNFARFRDIPLCSWGRGVGGEVRIRKLGPLSDAEKRDFFAAIDIFALPSRSDSFGLVLLEAWANGVPNVAYRAGGVADVIRNEIDGLLVPCGDIAGLTEALRRLTDDIDLRVRLGVDGKARVPIDFRWEDKLALVRQKIEISVPRREEKKLSGERVAW